jgi:tubulin--tyrosine ligase
MSSFLFTDIAIRYSVNVPLIPELLNPEPLPIRMTTIWRNGYQRLFEAYEEKSAQALERPEPGPDTQQGTSTAHGKKQLDPEKVGGLVFKWSPEMKGMLNPSNDECPSGCDARVLSDGCVSVTPLRASYAHPESLDTSVVLKL